ncbi:putative copia-type protein [Tanacetum coccineum]
MFTTINYDFLETKYFYSPQHNGQGEEQCDTLSWLRYTSEERCPNQNTTSARAQEQSSPNISATKDIVPNLISEVSNSQPSDSLDEIPKNIHETVGVQEHEEPTLIEVPEKYVLPARGDRVTCLIIYVDDMIITGNVESEIKKLKEGLCAEFKMKDLGNLRNLVTWKSKKQKVISLSSVEAEFRGIAKGLAEALWIRKLVSEIGFPPKESIRIMSDNKAAIQISKNPVQHDITKHVEVDRHFIKEKLETEIIKLPFVKYEDQLADILTKAVGMVILHKCPNKLNFGDPTIQLEGEC